MSPCFFLVVFVTYIVATPRYRSDPQRLIRNGWCGVFTHFGFFFVLFSFLQPLLVGGAGIEGVLRLFLLPKTPGPKQVLVRVWRDCFIRVAWVSKLELFNGVGCVLH